MSFLTFSLLTSGPCSIIKSQCWPSEGEGLGTPALSDKPPATTIYRNCAHRVEPQSNLEMVFPVPRLKSGKQKKVTKYSVNTIIVPDFFHFVL